MEICKEHYMVLVGPQKWQHCFKEKDPIFHVHHAAEEMLAKMPKHIIFSAEFDDEARSCSQLH